MKLVKNIKLFQYFKLNFMKNIEIFNKKYTLYHFDEFNFIKLKLSINFKIIKINDSIQTGFSIKNLNKKILLSQVLLFTL